MFSFSSNLLKMAAVLTLAIGIFAGEIISFHNRNTNIIAGSSPGGFTSSQDATLASASSGPSTVKPTPETIAAYQVSPANPRYINIHKLGVNARIFSTGLKNDGSLGTPDDIFDTDWYSQSSLPGQAGAMLIDGHSGWYGDGIFTDIGKLIAGDKITVTNGAGKEFTYTVVKTQVFPVDNVDMSSLMVSQDISKPGLNLISCTGDYVPQTNSYDKRVVVYSVLN